MHVWNNVAVHFFRLFIDSVMLRGGPKRGCVDLGITSDDLAEAFEEVKYDVLNVDYRSQSQIFFSSLSASHFKITFFTIHSPADRED